MSEPSQVRGASSSRSDASGLLTKAETPSPRATGPTIRWISSTSAAASRSFQSVLLPNTRISPPSPCLSSATRRCAFARLRISVVSRHGSVSSGVSVSETTTFSISLSRREISRCTGLASGSSATEGQKLLNPVYVVRPSRSVSAARSRSAHASSNAGSNGSAMRSPAGAGREAVERDEVVDDERAHGAPRPDATPSRWRRNRARRRPARCTPRRGRPPCCRCSPRPTPAARSRSRAGTRASPRSACRQWTGCRPR